MEPMVSSELAAATARALESFDGIAAVLVFGSQATGRARDDSDIDVAILFENAPPPAERKELLRMLFVALGRELSTERLDLVILNDAPSKLAFHVLRDGQVVLERLPELLHRFRVATYSRHADYEPIERFFAQVTKARAMAVKTHG